MDLRHLRSFVAVAEELHFGRAARRLSISQPPLTRQIQQLEGEVGARLFLRTKREVRLTPAGSTFLPHARSLLERLRDSIVEARSVGRGESGSLRLAYVPTAGVRIVPAILRALKELHPGVSLRLDPVSPPGHLEAVRGRHADFGIGWLPTEANDLVLEPLVREPHVIALPEDHPLARRKELPLRALNGVPLVFFPRHVSPESFDYLTGFFRTAGMNLNVGMEAPSIPGILSAVAGGMGVALVPDCMRDSPPKGVVFRRIAGPRPLMGWALAYHRGEKTGAEATFLRVIRELYPAENPRAADPV